MASFNTLQAARTYALAASAKAASRCPSQRSAYDDICDEIADEPTFAAGTYDDAAAVKYYTQWITETDTACTKATAATVKKTTTPPASTPPASTPAAAAGSDQTLLLAGLVAAWLLFAR